MLECLVMLKKGFVFRVRILYFYRDFLTIGDKFFLEIFTAISNEHVVDRAFKIAVEGSRILVITGLKSNFIRSRNVIGRRTNGPASPFHLIGLRRSWI